MDLTTPVSNPATSCPRPVSDRLSINAPRHSIHEQTATISSSAPSSADASVATTFAEAEESSLASRPTALLRTVSSSSRPAGGDASPVAAMFSDDNTFELSEDAFQAATRVTMNDTRSCAAVAGRVMDGAACVAFSARLTPCF